MLLSPLQAVAARKAPSPADPRAHDGGSRNRGRSQRHGSGGDDTAGTDL